MTPLAGPDFRLGSVQVFDGDSDKASQAGVAAEILIVVQRERSQINIFPSPTGTLFQRSFICFLAAEGILLRGCDEDLVICAAIVVLLPAVFVS